MQLPAGAYREPIMTEDELTPDWPLERRQDYFDWARRVIDGLRGSHPILEAAFDVEYGRRLVS